MKEEIEVGEYVRTKEGYIAKCIEIDEDKDYFTFDNCVEVKYGETFYSLYNNELKNIVKHSHNLIDLIEERRLCEWEKSVFGWNSNGKYSYD